MSAAIYDRVTKSIIDELERGTAPWVKPWKSGLAGRGANCLPYNAATGRSYAGVNILTLWAAAVAGAYPLPGWLTFRQAKEAGGFVRKGEKATPIVFLKRIPVEDDRGNDPAEPRRRKEIPVLRSFFVFNVAQVDGLPDRFVVPSEPPPEEERHVAAEVFLAAIGADVRHVGDRACYVPALDCINLPPFTAFESPEHYYATRLHETGHWSGHERRLARDLSGRFGTRAYAAEELVAELTAAFLCAHLRIEGHLRHAEYIGSWLELLKADNRAVFTAASRATDAANYLRSFSETPDDTHPEGEGDAEA